MKLFLIVAIAVALSVVAKADDWVLKDQFVPPVAKRPAGRVRLAGVDRLPERLPIGSPEIMRDYMVATNGGWLGLMLIEAGVGFISPTGSWVEITAQKTPAGYGSYPQALEDIERGVKVALGLLEKRTNLTSQTEIWGVLLVSHFADQPNLPLEVDTYSLFIANRTGLTRENIDSQKVIDQFRIGRPTVVEQVIIPVPPLRYLQMEVEVGEDLLASYTWERGSVSLKSWPASAGRLVAVGYLYFGTPWYGSKKPARVNIVTDNGLSGQYTEYGDPIAPPYLVQRQDGTIEVFGPRGAELEVMGSEDLVTWKLIWTGRTTATKTILTVPSSAVRRFVRASVR